MASRIMKECCGSGRLREERHGRRHGKCNRGKPPGIVSYACSTGVLHGTYSGNMRYRSSLRFFGFPGRWTAAWTSKNVPALCYNVALCNVCMAQRTIEYPTEPQRELHASHTHTHTHTVHLHHGSREGKTAATPAFSGRQIILLCPNS